MTIQEQYNLIKEGKGNKSFLMKSIRNTFPEYVNQYTSFKDAINILKNKGIITELVGGDIKKPIVSKNWFGDFKTSINEAVKAEEKTTSKEVLDDQKNMFDTKDLKNIDNLFGQSFLNGYYAEMKDPENWDKSVDELKGIVAKNMAKDINYYAKNAMFGEKGIGITDKAPGLGIPKEAKGKYKSSGYGDLDVEVKAIKANTKDTLSSSEAKTTMPKKVKEMSVIPQSSKGVKKMKMPGKFKTIKLKEEFESILDRTNPWTSGENEHEILQLAYQLEKANDDNNDTYFIRGEELEPNSKSALEAAGYSVEYTGPFDFDEEQLPLQTYTITKKLNEGVINSIINLLK